MASLALSPVSVAVFSTLNVAGLTALVGSRIYDDVPQAPTFPFVSYEVRERDVRGFGTGGLPEVELRVHAYSTYAGMKEAQSVIAAVILLLKDQALTITGYTHCGRVFYDEAVSLSDQMVNGIKCHELVAMFRIYAEQT